MSSLLSQVKSKMMIYSHEKTRELLSGEYGSVFKGRSMDFDDLREYVIGDDTKDIDWKATARSGNTLIRRYIAIRKHNILLIVDTGKNMAAVSESGDIKRDVSIMVAGAISSIAVNHGDLVGMLSGDTESNSLFHFKGESSHIEQILQHIQKATRLDSPRGKIANQLDYAARNLRRKMITVVISDDSHINEECQRRIRNLRAQHEILWVTIGDASGLKSHIDFFDIDNDLPLLRVPRLAKAIRASFEEANKVTIDNRMKFFNRMGIVEQRINGESEVMHDLYRLLERSRYARIR